MLCKQFLRHRPLHREAPHRPWRRGRASFSQHLGNRSFDHNMKQKFQEQFFNFLSASQTSRPTKEVSMAGIWVSAELGANPIIIITRGKAFISRHQVCGCKLTADTDSSLFTCTTGQASQNQDRISFLAFNTIFHGWIIILGLQ